MKKGKWIIGAVMIVVLTITFLQYKDMLPVLLQGDYGLTKVQEVKIGETVEFDSMNMTVKEIAIDRDLKRYPQLIGKKFDTLVGLKETENGEIAPDRAIVSVHMVIENKSLEETALNFVHVEDRNGKVLREAQLNDFREDQSAADYFHVKLKEGEVIDYWIGIPITQEDKKEQLYVVFGTGGGESEFRRKIPLQINE